ncbi:hypothetical protein ALC57_15941 [Trachymyrmex cornetzi]|uniref:Uncharacterized protein n=1 Tax=Trachymyrmex cornetzi TaxID=471704 RepID=A0A195DFY2_9HYME|nr:hypothetical protein ALC57_15941 [Trachymyrmex cornetzi]
MSNNQKLTAENADHANGSNELYTAAHKLAATPICIFTRPLNGQISDNFPIWKLNFRQHVRAADAEDTTVGFPTLPLYASDIVILSIATLTGLTTPDTDFSESCSFTGDTRVG